MATFSYFGESAPPGTFTAHNDGGTVRYGSGFYFTEGPLRGAPYVGGRAWVPAGNAGKTLTLYAYLGGADLPANAGRIVLSSPPAASKTVTVTNNAAHWVTALWDAPLTIPATLRMVGVAAEWTGAAAGDYYYSSTGRVGTDGKVHSDFPTWWWSDDELGGGGPPASYAGAFYSANGGETQKAAVTAHYGVDILIEVDSGEPEPGPVANAGASQVVVAGATVTLNGSASSAPAGISTYTWTQTSGPTVTLAGSGATRTFTAATAGNYSFQLVITDGNGASSEPATTSVTVTNVAPTTPDSIAVENAKAGLGKEHWLEGVNTEDMPSFARSTYYQPGSTAKFSVNYNEPFTVDIFRLGHYSGLGGRRVAQDLTGTPAAQPAPAVIPGSNGAVTCAAWSENAEWAIPANAVPGWYLALFRGQDGKFGFSLFTVSDTAAKKPILLVSSDATWHAAYNGFGGNNVYGAAKGIGATAQRALCSTYDKPVITYDYVPQTHFFNSQFAAFKYMESLGFEVGYATTEQINNDPSVLDGRQVIVFAGHNEYVPQRMMNKVKALLAGGQKIVNWAANDFFWRVTFAGNTFPAGATSQSTGRVMWCKKDTQPGPTAIRSWNPGQPFTTAGDWTGTWQDTRWTLREPSTEFMGDRFIANGIRADAVTVPASYKDKPIWRNCPGIQSLAPGSSFSFGTGTLGMEWDMPDGSLEMSLMSKTTVDLTAGGASDANGENYNLPGSYDHGIALVRSGSGLVFNFNSDQWGIALDNLHHSRTPAVASTEARQACLNVLVDFGAQPNAAMVSAAGLAMPTPVTNVAVAYGLSEDTTTPPPPVQTGEHGTYYSDGTTWHTLG